MVRSRAFSPALVASENISVIKMTTCRLWIGALRLGTPQGRVDLPQTPFLGNLS